MKQTSIKECFGYYEYEVGISTLTCLELITIDISNRDFSMQSVNKGLNTAVSDLEREYQVGVTVE